MKDNKYMSQNIETLRHELKYYKDKLEPWLENIAYSILNILWFILNAFVQLIVVAFTIALGIGIFVFPMYAIMQCIMANKLIEELPGTTKEDIIDELIEHGFIGTVLFPALFVYSSFALISLFNAIIQTPNAIYSMFQIFEIKKTIELKENLKEEENLIEEVEEVVEEEKEEELEETENQIVSDIEYLTDQCNLINEENREDYMKRLMAISLEYKARYVKITRNKNSKKIDLESDNYEKLKSDICRQISLLKFAIKDELDIQEEVNAFSNKMDSVIDNIDLSTKQMNQTLSLRK